jgi:hypothetical protein
MANNSISQQHTAMSEVAKWLRFASRPVSENEPNKSPYGPDIEGSGE